MDDKSHEFQIYHSEGCIRLILYPLFRRKELQGHGFLNMCQVSCVKPGQHKSHYYWMSKH